MKVMLDTCAYSALMNGDRSILEALAEAESIYLPVVVIGELLSGFGRGNRYRENLKRMESFLGEANTQVAAITEKTAYRYAEIDNYLDRQGTPIPRNDLWIAASAMEHGCDLLTYDSHFRRVPLLPVRP